MKTLFHSGEVLPMDGSPTGQAMLIENGKIRAVGSREELHSLSGDAHLVDLEGRTVMPAFMDAHSHLSSYALSFLQADLETAESFSDILLRLRAFCEKNQVREGEWLIAGKYDHNRLREKSHPTGEMLDAAFPGIKVALQHQSGHLSVMSSPALEALGMKGKDRNGYLEENDYLEAAKKIPLPSSGQLLEAYRKTMKHYASYGITTAQEGLMVSQMLPLYQQLLSQKAMTLDVVGYPQIQEAARFEETLADYTGQYRDHFRLGGYKIILDGSPQGRTAWITQPYAGTEGEFGVSSMTDQEVTAALEKSVRDGRQLLAHCNGDAAAEQFLTCVEKMSDSRLFALRPVMIHAQLLRPDQIPRLKKTGIIPSFFVAHCYYWGDVHLHNLGRERAERISPANHALREGIPFTFHQDAPVLEPDMMGSVWCAVNRLTRDGVLLGEEERIPVGEALKAVTINAAYQYEEERVKGTLTPGKQADFILLDKNPMRVQPEELNRIRVLETWKAGECIYQA